MDWISFLNQGNHFVFDHILKNLEILHNKKIGTIVSKLNQENLSGARIRK